MLADKPSLFHTKFHSTPVFSPNGTITCIDALPSVGSSFPIVGPGGMQYVPGAHESLRVDQSSAPGVHSHVKLPSVSVHVAAGGPLSQSCVCRMYRLVNPVCVSYVSSFQSCVCRMYRLVNPVCVSYVSSCQSCVCRMYRLVNPVCVVCSVMSWSRRYCACMLWRICREGEGWACMPGVLRRIRQCSDKRRHRRAIPRCTCIHTARCCWCM